MRSVLLTERTKAERQLESQEALKQCRTKISGIAILQSYTAVRSVGVSHHGAPVLLEGLSQAVPRLLSHRRKSGNFIFGAGLVPANQ